MVRHTCPKCGSQNIYRYKYKGKKIYECPDCNWNKEVL